MKLEPNFFRYFHVDYTVLFVYLLILKKYSNSISVFQNKLGDTALHAAAWKGYADIVELLLKKSECLILFS